MVRGAVDDKGRCFGVGQQRLTFRGLREACAGWAFSTRAPVQEITPPLERWPLIKWHPSTRLGQTAPNVNYNKNPQAGPGYVVEQQYLPDCLRDRVYYEPTDQGSEKEVKKRLEAVRRILRSL